MIKTVQIRLRSMEAVNEFCDRLRQCPGDYELQSGRFTANARSLMGIFSMDLSHPLTLRIHAPEEVIPLAIQTLAPFIQM